VSEEPHDPLADRPDALVDLVPSALLLVSGAIGLVVWYSGLDAVWDARTVPDVVDPHHVLLALVAGFLGCTPLLAGFLPVTTAALALVATASLVATGQASDRILAAPLLTLVVVALITVPRRLARARGPAAPIHPGDIRRAPVPLPRLPLRSAHDEVVGAVVLAVVGLVVVGAGAWWTDAEVRAVRELRAGGVVVTTPIADVTYGGRRKLVPTALLDMPDGTRVALRRAVAWDGLEVEVRWLPGTDRVEETSNPERPTRQLGVSGVGLGVLVGAGALARRAVVAHRQRSSPDVRPRL